MTSILSARGVKRHYGHGKGRVCAVDGVDLDLGEGEVIGIVGESGSGKSTLARILVGLDSPDQGSVQVAGVDWASARGDARRRLRRIAQMVFQDPFSSLNPRQRVRDIVAEPMVIHDVGTRESRRRDVLRLLHRVGLSPDAVDRYPHQFSGGQRQRIAIARALALKPRVIIADEPVSALDVSVQAQIVNLLADLRDEMKLAMVFVSHDLGVVRFLADRVMVMYRGRVVETGPTDAVFAQPRHPYAQLLCDSARPIRPIAPGTGGAVNPIGAPVSLGDHSASGGCAFAPRCSWAEPSCLQTVPELLAISPDRQTACPVRGR